MIVFEVIIVVILVIMEGGSVKKLVIPHSYITTKTTYNTRVKTTTYNCQNTSKTITYIICTRTRHITTYYTPTEAVLQTTTSTHWHTRCIR